MLLLTPWFRGCKAIPLPLCGHLLGMKKLPDAIPSICSSKVLKRDTCQRLASPHSKRRRARLGPS